MSFMADWPATFAISASSQPELYRGPDLQPLHTVSGNRQTAALDRHGGAENQDPHYPPLPEPSLSHTKLLAARPPEEVPPETNDAAYSAIDRLHHRHRRRQRQQQRPHGTPAASKYPDRSYLFSKGFRDYAARSRMDIGRDTKQVWSEKLEAAFHEALVVIELGGMQKRSRNGKPFGRNQLISEYITEKTGEYRCRKQVMSHIQVLNPYLKDQPSWQALIKKGKKGSYAQSANRGQYEERAAERGEQPPPPPPPPPPQQQQQQAYFSSQQPSFHDESIGAPLKRLPRPSQTLGSNDFASRGKRVAGVNFEMWMSPNQGQMGDRLHDFTSLQSDRGLPRCDPSPLEDIRDWRTSYPGLMQRIDGAGERVSFDIIMVDTSFKMMADFPPPKASLGLLLELNLVEPGAAAETLDWTCTTHLYHKGVHVKRPSHYRLDAKWGTISPPFESMWWAETFISQVEQRRQAESSGPTETTYGETGEPTQGIFSQLSAMHEIHAGPSREASKEERRLVAVLLWKFSIAPAPYVGTTSWQRLVPPPARISTNSPCPSRQQMSLPPLVMDSVVEGSEDLASGMETAPSAALLGGHGDSQGLGGGNLDFSFGDEAMADFASSFQSSLAASTQAEGQGCGFGSMDHLDYGLPLAALPGGPSPEGFPGGIATDMHAAGLYAAVSNLPFEPHPVFGADMADAPPQGYEQRADLGGGSEDESQMRRPLANFDHNTHHLLQAQLDPFDFGGAPRPPPATPSPDSIAHPHPPHGRASAMHATLAAASAMNELQGKPAVVAGPDQMPGTTTTTTSTSVEAPSDAAAPAPLRTPPPPPPGRTPRPATTSPASTSMQQLLDLHDDGQW